MYICVCMYVYVAFRHLPNSLLQSIKSCASFATITPFPIPLQVIMFNTLLSSQPLDLFCFAYMIQLYEDGVQ